MEDERGKYSVLIPDAEFWKQMVPCQAACPVHTDAGRYVQLIAIGEYREAYLTARSPNPFASDCGRVCAAPCEDRCRRGKIDAPVSIRALKRFVCEKYGAESFAPDTQDELFHGATEQGNKTPWHLPLLTVSRNNVARGQKVAVIGAGPAGLSCAHDLALMGYQVTVFEASGTPGGMMVHGIPEFRLARAVIDKEIAKITSLGVELKLNAPLNEQFGLRQLRELGYQSAFLSVGTQRGRGMTVEGQELDGVVKAIDFLLNVNNGYKVELGKRVLVIGGGFVAFDAARMALRTALEGQPAAEGNMAAALDAARAAVRAGVTDVRMMSLESFAELPVMRTAQGKEEFEEAEREGIHFHPQRGARRFIGRNGRVEAVELIGVSRTYDDNGRFNPVYDESVHETVEADTVILAIGQQADLSFLNPADGVELTRAGTVKVDPETLATSAAGIFAGGDVAFGPRNLIEAIANGKQAALSIDNYLRDVKGGPEIRFSIRKISTRDYRMPEDYEQHRTPGSSDHADRPAHRIFRSRDRLLRTGGAPAGGAVPFMPHPDHLRRRHVRPVQPLCGRLPGVLPQARAARSTGPWSGAGSRAGALRSKRRGRRASFGNDQGRRQVHSMRSVRHPLPHRRHDDGGFLL